MLATATALFAGVLFALATPRGTTDQSLPEKAEQRAANQFAASTARQAAHFELNVGQGPDGVPLLARAQSYTASIAAESATFGLRPRRPDTSSKQLGPNTDDPVADSTKGTVQRVVTLEFEETRPQAQVVPGERQAGRTSYIHAGRSSGEVSADRFESMKIIGIYDRIDMLWRSDGNNVAFDFELGPGADPTQIRIAVEGGSTSQHADGSLGVTTPDGELLLSPPRASQSDLAGRTTVSSSFSETSDGSIGIDVGEYDTERPLTIDPTILFSSYFGGTNDERVSDVRVDAEGSTYVAGETKSADFPVKSLSGESPCDCSSTFVSKFNSASILEYSSLLPYSDESLARLAVDPSGHAYLLGHDADGPASWVTTPHLGGGSGGTDFVLKLNTSGTALEYASTFGGNGVSRCYCSVSRRIDKAIAVDSLGSVYVALSGGYWMRPLVNPFQTTEGPLYLAKITPSGTDLVYGSYVGSYGNRISPLDVAVDSVGAVYVTGTSTGGLPIVNPLPNQTAPQGQDAFVTKFAASGQSIEYSTYLGGNTPDSGWGIAVDSVGSAYVTGFTGSTNFPTKNAVTPENPLGAYRAFVTKLTASGSELEYSTYLGGFDDYSTFGRAIGIDRSGNATIVGETQSSTYLVENPLQDHLAGPTDAFVASLSPAGNQLNYSTYLGGTGDDSGWAIAIDNEGNAFAAGDTKSPDFPMAYPLKDGPSIVKSDAFLIRISPLAPPPGTRLYLAEGAATGGFETWVLLTNPDANPTSARLKFLTDSGPVPGPTVDIQPNSRRSVRVNAYVNTYQVATIVESDNPRIVAERAVYSQEARREGAHLARAAQSTSGQWYLPEGAAMPGFETWTLVMNPSESDTATVRVDYLTDRGLVTGPTVTVAPGQRRSIRSNDYVQGFDVSARVLSWGAGVVVERATYINYGVLKGATDSPGVTTPAPTWYMAEGASDGGFTTWILVANPNPALAATVTFTYSPPTGPVPGPVIQLGPGERRSIRTNDFVKQFDVPATVTSTGADIVAERATYSSHGVYGHGAASGEGVKVPATSWTMAEGSTGPGFDTWLLVANFSTTETASAQLTYLTAVGPISGPRLSIPPMSRRSVRANETVATYDLSTHVDSDKPVVVDRSVFALSRASRDMTSGPGIPGQ